MHTPHYRTVVARKALFLVRLMSFLCSQKSHKKDDMKHIRELQLLLSEYFNLSGHNLECLSFFVIGMFMVQTVNLAKLSKTFSTEGPNLSQIISAYSDLFGA